MQNLKNRWALVTGASSGLGVDFAAVLAEWGMNVVIVARREDRLLELKSRLESEHKIKVEAIGCDLTGAGAVENLTAALDKKGIEIEVLVNNAGFGLHGDFKDLSWERQHEMIQLDITVLVHLTKVFVDRMVRRRSGYVLQVGSIGAFQPAPNYAVYSAAKAFVLSFGEAIAYELRNSGVKASVLCPGVTESEFLLIAGQPPNAVMRMTRMKSRPVVEAGLRAMLAGKPSLVTGWINKFTVWSQRILTRKMSARLAALATKN